MRRAVVLLLCVLLAWGSVSSAGAEVKIPDPLWYETDPKEQTVVHLHFFWTRYCPHCQEALPFIAQLEKKHAWLRIHRYELTASEDNVKLFGEMAKRLGQQAISVPAFLFCRTMWTGFGSPESTGRRLEAELLACRQNAGGQVSPTTPSPTLSLPILGEIEPGKHSLPVLTLLIAGLDAFNPCAFFVLLFLMSLLVRSQDPKRMAVIGGLFVFFSGVMYFVFMAAWLNLFLLIGELAVVTFLAGLIAVAIGAVNIKDYFYFGRGFSLSIPASLKPRLFEKMRHVVEAGQWPAMMVSTAVLAIAANSYELLCTAGFPMVYTRILTLSHLNGPEYYVYLLLYNLIYVVPLLVIVALFIRTMGTKKLGEREGRLLKLVSGLMMLGLGVLLMFAPELLNDLMAAFLLVACAVVISGLLVWRDHNAAV